MERGLNVLGSFQKPFHIQEFEDVLTNYTKKSQKQLTASDELPPVEELQRATDNEELFLVYQPQVNIVERSVVGFEALVRWKHPTRGMILPSYFIPIAEENGLFSEITTITAKIAIQQQGMWKSQGDSFRVSINISPKILDELDLPEKLETLALKAGADIEHHD